MIENVIFVIGMFVFGLTVWGAVMAGGFALTRTAPDAPRDTPATSSSPLTPPVVANHTPEIPVTAPAVPSDVQDPSMVALR